MISYTDAYKQGVYDKDKGLPMTVPSALNNIDAFRGYFDGYGGNQHNPPSKKQDVLEFNLKKVNFIT